MLDRVAAVRQRLEFEVMVVPGEAEAFALDQIAVDRRAGGAPEALASLPIVVASSLMPLAAPALTRDDYLERIVGRIPQEAQEAPLSALQSEIADRARRAMEAGDVSKVEELRQQCSTLIGFTEYRFPRYQPARHHRLIASHLERVERREIDRLMLLVPPRHGKTELASKSYPAWSLGRSPWKQFLSASATYDLAGDWGKAVRNIIASEEYTTVFPTRLSEDSRAAGKWNTQQGGSYYALGVGGTVMGRGADDWLIDDPYGSIKDAKSEVVREDVWEWFNGTVYNRLQPGGSIVLINHRMHEDDLSGRLIEKMKAGGDQWTIVELPAIANSPHDPLGRSPGEALWPEWFPIHPELERRQANTLPRYWSALYQQNPVPDEGELFSPDRITLRSHTDDVILWARGWDLAGSVDGDYAVGALVGLKTKTRMNSPLTDASAARAKAERPHRRTRASQPR